jgi:hypothetical protein
MENEDDEIWELVFSTTIPYKAEIIKAVLEEENITCVIINKQDSSYLSFGEIELYVKRNEVLQAKHILNREDIGE